MTSRSKEKVASVLQRLFRTSEKVGVAECKDGVGGSGGGGSVGSSSGSVGQQAHSPARRLLRHHAVTPAQLTGPSEAQGPPPPIRPPSASSFFKKKSTPREGAAAIELTHQKSVRNRRLMKELQDIQRSQRKDPAFTVELINDNLYDWHIRLYSIDSESELAIDMREMGIPFISLQMTFPENFPFAPPFMRVMSPKIEKGFVMEGGAICMELLTPRGWASAYTVEAIVMQFAASIVKGQGRISKKSKNTSKDFNRRSAEESFRSLVKTHDKYGWVTPPLSDG